MTRRLVTTQSLVTWEQLEFQRVLTLGILLKSHGHPQPSNRGYTTDRQRSIFQNRSHLYSYWLQFQDGDWQDQPDNSLSLKTLRLVCSRFNGAFEAQVLSTLVIVVMYNNLKQSLDMLRTFASQNKTTSRAVQHARTLKIKLLSPLMAMDSKFFEPEPESHDLSPGPPSLTRRLASAISSLKRRFKWVCSFSCFLRIFLTC